MRKTILAFGLMGTLISSVVIVKAQQLVTQEERRAVVAAITAKIADLEVRRLEMLGNYAPDAVEISDVNRTLINLRARLREVSDPDSVPLPPTSELRATSSEGQVRLAWKPVKGAGSYKVIYWYYGINWTVLKTVNTPRATITGLTNGRPYVFAISAERKGVTSVWGHGTWKRVEATLQGKRELRAIPFPSPAFPARILNNEESVYSFTPWLTSAEYQARFDEEVKHGLYPVVAEGRAGSAGNQYRAVFKPTPEYSAAWLHHISATKEVQEKEAEKRKAEGYQQVWLQKFRDADGIERYQTVWMLIR